MAAARVGTVRDTTGSHRRSTCSVAATIDPHVALDVAAPRACIVTNHPDHFFFSAAQFRAERH